MKCLNCNKNTSNPKFCSRSCSVTQSNKTSPKRKKSNSNKKCLRCNNQVNDKRSKHCSQECFAKTRWIKQVQKIEKSGIIHPKGVYHSSNIAKRYISEIHGNKCQICGQKPFWNNQSLIMILDHINGIPDDWRISNLRLVCPNCDTQLPTFKSKNKNGGRPR